MATLLVNILENFLGECRRHNEETGQTQFDCPACSEEKGLVDGDGKGNLEINYQMNKFKCWSCGDRNNMHGPVIKLLKRYATPKIIRDYLLVKPDANTALDNKREYEKITLPEGFKLLSKCTSKDYKSQEALSYLNKRGITPEIIEDFKIGYSNKGKFYNRIIIPSFDSDNQLNYFIARWFDSKKNKLKYLNPSAEKQEIVFNEKKINWDATIYLVEGVFDHIVTPNSIPLLGKVISNKLLDLLLEKSGAYVVVFLDSDAWDDAILLYKKLNFGNLFGRVKIIKPPENYDPSKLFEIGGSKILTKVLKTSRFLTNDEYY